MVLIMYSGINQLSSNKKLIEYPGFVYLHDVDPTIMADLRYAGIYNFVGQPLKGYIGSEVILTKDAALALKEAQKLFNELNYEIVIYDAYRPLKTVEQMLKWSRSDTDQSQKQYYYPRVDKSQLFNCSYIALRSGHSRGSTVDLTLIEKGHCVHTCIPIEKEFYGVRTLYLDDGTIDMGTSWDLFDELSHTYNDLLSPHQYENRIMLKEIMEKCGFRGIDNEWWHFKLVNEPYPDTYWDFDIK